jgi:FKBP-type peptidyl-prolyl cis-trans isomerase FkpA
MLNTKMMKKTLLLAGASALMLSSCKNDSLFEGYTKAESGLHYKFFTHAEDAPKPQEGSGIAIRYAIKKQSNDSLLVDSKMSVQDGSGVYRQVMGKPSCKGGIEDAIAMLSKGDSASFIISADSFFLKTNKMNELPPFIKKGDYLTVNIKMVDLLSKTEIEANQKKQMAEQQAMDAEMSSKEKAVIEKYIADNKLAAVADPSGLFFAKEKEGIGDLAQDGDSLIVAYTGMLLDGRVFDSSSFEDAKNGGLEKPAEYCKPIPVLLGNRGVIEGWEIALRQMKKGTKAKVILPFAMAYGARGNGERIPPYSPLVFKMEIISIKKNK